MTDWADDLVTKLLDNTPELKHVTLREIMAMALRDERERAATKCEEQAKEFLSTQYSFHQPIGSIAERFACAECAKAIRSGE